MTDKKSPIDEEMLLKLDPEFITFYNATLADKPGLHEIPWDPALRNGPPIVGASEPLQVGFTEDIQLDNCKIRAFVPEPLSELDGTKLPALLYFHGGGWTLGNIDTENHFCTRMCIIARCIVISVDYRLGPENPYPAAVQDAKDAFKWLRSKGTHNLPIDVSRLAVGGSSSGGNLAAVLTHTNALSDDPVPLLFQLLVVPVVDNTASPSGKPYYSWYENRKVPSLTPEKMLWFRHNYLPENRDREQWESSPILAPANSFKNVPDAWIGVAELDILRDEGIAYAKKLQDAGHRVELKIYGRAPHPITAMDSTSCVSVSNDHQSLINMYFQGNDQNSSSLQMKAETFASVLKVGRELIADAAEALKNAFWGRRN